MVANAECPNAADEDTAVATIAITDQITRDLLPTTCFSQLIGDPFRCRVSGHAEPQDLAAAKAHDQQSVEKPERGGRHHKQVDRSHAVRMIAQEGPPPL